MPRYPVIRPAIAKSVLLLTVVFVATAHGGEMLKHGDAVPLPDGQRGVITKLESLPYVQDSITARFQFDSYDNPKLKLLREQYRLDEVIAPGKDEFEKQLLLLDWVNHRFHKFGKPTSNARGAIDILAANEKGSAFFCAHYADVFVSAAASLGWIDRPLALRRPDNIGEGSTEHSSTEIWSNQYRKWIVLDPTFAMYVEKDGIPLNAYEIRQEWFYHDGEGLVFVLDKERRRYRKSDMPVLRQRYEGFGDLKLDGGALNPYAFIGYIPNTDLMTRGPDYGQMFITKDRICEGTNWHERLSPADPEHGPYFPINQAAMTLRSDGDTIHVRLETFTPNFKAFFVRIDQGEWKPSEASFDWPPHAGTNLLEAKAVNRFGVEGPVSRAEISAGAE